MESSAPVQENSGKDLEESKVEANPEEQVEKVIISKTEQEISQPEEKPQSQEEQKEVPSDQKQDNSPSKDSDDKKGEWVPTEKRRPEDEFFDLSTIHPIEEFDVLGDGSIIKLIIQKGVGSTVAPEDTVYWKHETRFDNGQLVDLGETRKVSDKFIMHDSYSHEFLRQAFGTIQKGEISFLKLSPDAHKNIYHQTIFKPSNLNKQRDEKELEHMRNTIGQTIYIKITVTNIKRDPMCDAKATWDEKIIFYDKVRAIGKELCQEGEFSNAKNLYSRCIGVFKNMPKKQRESLTDEMVQKRTDVLGIMNTNCAACLLKKFQYNDAIKHCNEALTHSKDNAKAYYRMSQAYKALHDLDRAKDNLLLAIKCSPNDMALRKEYKELNAEKNSKEHEWYSKMSGFYHNPKLAKIEGDDEQEKILREKVKRQQFQEM